MSDHRCGEQARRLAPARVIPGGGAQRLALCAVLMAGAAGCTSSPAYPIQLGERPGDSSVMATQPRYPMSARDAAEDAADRAAQNGYGRPGYPAYGAPATPPPQGAVYSAPPAAASPPPPADDSTDEAPRAAPQSSVESSDLPPPAPTPPADAYPAPPPAAPGPGQPQAISYGGGTIVFGTDSVGPAPFELAAYHHRRRHAEPAVDDPSAADAAPAPMSKTSKSKPGRVHAADASADAAPSAAADTPYQTVVRPGEKLAEVAARVHSSREALSALNDLKHPRHVKAGTVLKIPYRYSYEVQKGDTLYTIAHRFDQAPQAIAKLNGLKAVPTLQPGQSIDLPTTAEDTGKRDHASAAGPNPVAAPEKLADAALRKAERHGHRRRGEALAAETPQPSASETSGAAITQTASAETTHGRRGRRSRHDAALALAEPAPASPSDTSEPDVHPTESATADRTAPRPYTPPPTSSALAAAAATEPRPACGSCAARPCSPR